MKIVKFILFFFLVQNCLFAQQGNIWYFGNNAGIDFNSGTPVSITNGALASNEACASICDNTGTLLFYTDGVSVWDNTHSVMANGTGLMGNGTTTQTLIVQQPSSSTIYYIFTLDFQTNPDGFRYSQVDMNLNGGLGDVVVSNKNTLIVTPTCEKVAAIRHQNETDFWIITHLFGSNTFNSYLLTASGLNMTPVSTNIGFVVSNAFNSRGYLKGSPDGTRIISANSANSAELFDFDNSTGVLSNLLSLNIDNPYGVEFSPNSNLVYVSEAGPISTPDYISQFNLLAGSATDIVNSKTTVNSVRFGALQLAPDGKIYHARPGRDSLGVINNPNLVGLAFNYVDASFYLTGPGSYLTGPGKVVYGLPNFHNAIMLNPATFTATNLCFGDSTFFTITPPLNADSVLWNFDDLASGTNNTSTDTLPFHIFTDTGTFNVSLIRYLAGVPDTVTNAIFINPTPTINLGNDTSICDGDNLVLDATTAGATYVWQDGSTNSTFNVTLVGTYGVEITIGTCTAIDSIIVNIDLLPTVTANTTANPICSGDNITLTGGGATSYLWDNGVTDGIAFAPPSTTTYTVTGIDANNCEDTAQITITISPSEDPAFSYSASSYCSTGTDPTPVISGVNGGRFSSTPTGLGIDSITGTIDLSLSTVNTYGILYTTPGTNCPDTLTVFVTVSSCVAPIAGFTISRDTVCIGDCINITDQSTGGPTSWVWTFNGGTPATYTGKNPPSICFNTAGGPYTIEQVVSNGLGNDMADSTVLVNALPVVSAGNDVEIELGESTTLTAVGSFGTYSWSPPNWLSCVNNCTDPIATPEETITYTVSITDANNCSADDQVTVTVNFENIVFVPNIFSPNGDGNNDVLFVIGKTIESMQFIIYSRWGEKVFEASNPTNGWDGTFKGKPMNKSVFVYFLNITFKDGNTTTKKGDVTLVR